MFVKLRAKKALYAHLQQKFMTPFLPVQPDMRLMGDKPPPRHGNPRLSNLPSVLKRETERERERERDREREMERERNAGVMSAVGVICVGAV